MVLRPCMGKITADGDSIRCCSLQALYNTSRPPPHVTLSVDLDLGHGHVCPQPPLPARAPHRNLSVFFCLRRCCPASSFSSQLLTHHPSIQLHTTILFIRTHGSHQGLLRCCLDRPRCRGRQQWPSYQHWRRERCVPSSLALLCSLFTSDWLEKLLTFL
jgi:hypothetical protein